MHTKLYVTLDSDEFIDIPISVVLNHLDYTKIKILSPNGNKAHSESHRIDQMICIATQRVRINEVTLNYALKVHEK